MFFTKKNNPISTSGFTLIELMVVLVIMMVLAILVIAGYSEGRPRLAVERTVEGFVGDLYRIRQKSTSSVFYEKDNNGRIISGGYGILIEDDDEYSIFVDDEGTPKKVETINLEQHTKIISGDARIFFSSDGKVSFDDDPNKEQMDITFSARNDDSIKRTVSINSKGVARVIYE